MKGKAYVVGLGVVSAIGNSVAENLHALAISHSGIGPLTLLSSQLKLPVGEVKLSNEDLSKRLAYKRKNTSRTALLGILAAREALQNAMLSLKHWRTGLISATTVGGMDKTENFFIDFIQNPQRGRLRDVVDHECGSSTERIADELGVKNFIATINTACSSSINAVIYGARLIQHGHLDVVIAGGTDALTKFTLNGFNSLMILDKEPCRPFDASRAGLNLGEGAGFLVLVSEKVLQAEKAKPFGFVAGFGNTNDAFHQTASSPEGRGSFSAMQHALKMGELKPEAIDYINLHGTGTKNNDSSEGAAIQRLFDSTVPRLSSTKAFTGHTLGASGGIEAVYSMLAIQNGCVFPNLRFANPIPEMNFTPQQTFERDLPIRNVLSNSFGFGGNCSSIIFSKA